MTDQLEPQKPAESEFVPTAKQIAYLLRYVEVAGTQRGNLTDVHIGQLAKVKPGTISEWRRKPGFNAWMGQQIRATMLVGGLEKLLMKAHALGMTGNIAHMEFYAKYSGEAPVREPNGVVLPPGADGVTRIELLIPRP